MRSPRLRSPLARAVEPVLGGIAFFVVFFAGLWVAATVINNRADPGSKIANKVFEVGKVKDIAQAVAEGAPIVALICTVPPITGFSPMIGIRRSPGATWC